MLTAESACPQSTCLELSGALDDVLSREWLLADGLGGFAAGTVIGCPTRRYHGMLISPKRPPLDRYLLLSGTLDRVIIGQTVVDLSTYEFPGVFHPNGHELQTGFQLEADGPYPWVEFSYSHPLFEARKRLTVCTGQRAIWLSYEVTTQSDEQITLQVLPLVAMRDFHGMRRQEADQPWNIHNEDQAVWVQFWVQFLDWLMGSIAL